MRTQISNTSSWWNGDVRDRERVKRELDYGVTYLKDYVESRKVADDERRKGKVELLRLTRAVGALDEKFKDQEPLYKRIDGLINTSNSLRRILPVVVKAFETLGTGLEKME